MNTYQRFENESEEELIYRICSEKDQIGSWQDVANILNTLLNFEFTESKYRKQYQAFQKMFGANQNRFSNAESLLQEIKDEQLKLEKEKIKIRDERNELKRFIREEARKESYKEQIIRSIREFQSCPLSYNENKKFNGVIKSDNDLIVSCTDIHTGIEIENFFNHFNEDILVDRLRKYLDKIFEVQLRHGSENVYLILSELVSGIIHNSLRIENNQNLIEQFLLITTYLSEFIEELSYRFEQIHVYICPGNHSRVSPKKEDSLKGENIDHLALPFLEAKLQNFKNIHFHKNLVEESIAMFNVRGNKIFASHGDKDAPATVVQKFTMMFNIRPDIVYLGHRHQNGLTTVYNSKVIESGCLSGVDNYALDLRITGKPSQTISVITNNGLDCLYDVTF